MRGIGSVESWATEFRFLKEVDIIHDHGQREGIYSQAEMAFQLNKSAAERLKNVFVTCHFLAKYARPFTDFVGQCELDESKGQVW